MLSDVFYLYSRGVSVVETTLQDLHYGVRGMRRTPAFTLTAVITLALTTGAICTVLTLAYTLFFRSLPVDRPEEVVFVVATRRHGAITGPLDYPDYLNFRDRSRTTELAAHYPTAPLFVTVGDRSNEINGSVVSSNYFPLLGVKPALGRFFHPDEDSVPDRDRVTVVSHQFWRDWLGSSPEALGVSVRVNGTGFRVIGVAPPVFHGVISTPSDIYIPMMMLRVGYRWCDDSLGRGCTTLDMIGRLRSGRRLEEAQADMNALIPADWAQHDPDENTGIRVLRARGADPELGQIHFVTMLILVVGILLLVCCANIAGLLLARAAARRREFAIRASIGAGRSRLIRQLMTESFLLSVIGGIFGVMLSLTLTRTLEAMFYTQGVVGGPQYFDFSLSPVVILAVLGISIGAGLIFSFLPALNSSRIALGAGLTRKASRTDTPSRLSTWLVGGQAAVAVALVAVAALLSGSAHRFASGVNFDSSHVTLMRIRPRLLKYPPEKAQRFQRDVIRRLESLPGVEVVSIVGTGAALWGGSTSLRLREWVDGQSIESGYIEVGARYFQAVRTPLLFGREFDDRDQTGSPRVTVVNQTLARRLWNKENVLGATLLVNRQPHEVIGVVQDVPLHSRAETPQPYAYVPYWQNPQQVDARYCVRVKGDPSSMLASLVREVHKVDTDMPVSETVTLPSMITGRLRPVRVTATVLAYAAGLTVLLSALGLYGVLAFSVSRRTKEIGIRMAVGASSREVLAAVVRDGMKVIIIGVAAGLVLALLSSRLVRHLMYGAPESNAVYYIAAALLIIAVGLLASCLPARRAAAIEPLTALREE